VLRAPADELGALAGAALEVIDRAWSSRSSSWRTAATMPGRMSAWDRLGGALFGGNSKNESGLPRQPL